MARVFFRYPQWAKHCEGTRMLIRTSETHARGNMNKNELDRVVADICTGLVNKDKAAAARFEQVVEDMTPETYSKVFGGDVSAAEVVTTGMKLVEATKSALTLFRKLTT